MTQTELGQLIDAHDTVWNGWWPALSALAESDLHHMIVSSYPSVFATVQHMVGAEAFWQYRLDGRPLDTSGDSARDMAALQDVWRALRERRSAWVLVSDPDARVSFTLESGVSATAKVWECVTHLVSHAQYHRGQIVTMFRQLGLQPPSLDLLGAFSDAYGLAP